MVEIVRSTSTLADPRADARDGRVLSGAMTFRRGQLHYFVVVAEEGQMTRAAKRLEVAQPALSQAIAQLEGEVGVQLLERHARGVSLTAAGAVFYEKARRADEAAKDAARTARSLARGQAGTVEFGFVGSPPGLDSPEALEAFGRAYPEIELRYRALSFPGPSTSAWLAEVDVAVCHLPPEDPAVWRVELRSEPRALLTSARNPLATRENVGVADLLDELFVGLSPTVDPAWAGFWSLDDHRGGPPARRTDDRAGDPQEVLAALALGEAVTTVPASVARVIVSHLSGLASIPLLDARAATIALVGHTDQRNSLVSSLLSFARGGPQRGGADDNGRQGGAAPR
jgi:DNA-binding transcriptional LysR family regulator